jgi:hypothetical protein
VRVIAAMLMLAALAIGGGCTTSPDWIDRTLVTVDLTGTWQGLGASAIGSGSVSFELTLKQHGPKVAGSVRQEGRRTSGWGVPGEYSGPIDGTVAGDVLSFRQKNGSLQGEMAVSGDEMTGVVFSNDFSRRQITLRRVNSSSQPDSQQGEN